MKMKTLLASMALASLAVAQPVAAATRSADSLPESGLQATDRADRLGSITGEAEELSTAFAVVIVLALLGVLILAASGGKSAG